MRIIFLILILFIVSCSPSDEEKERVYNEMFQENAFEMKDTLLYYYIDTNKIIFEFSHKTNYNKWLVEAILINRKSENHISLAKNIEIQVRENKITFDGLNISQSELKDYYPKFIGFPILDFDVITIPFHNIRYYYSIIDTTKNTLAPDSISRTLKYAKLDFNVLRGVHPEIYKYCIDKLENTTGFKISEEMKKELIKEARNEYKK